MKSTQKFIKKTEPAKTIGHCIVINLPLLEVQGVSAKVDTGAFSGALHATYIRELRNKDDESYLRFAPLGRRNHMVQVKKYRKKRVRSSNGQVSIRYVIDTDIGILGSIYPATITLCNRKGMKYPVLIGRNFLRIHGFLIDLNK